GWRRGGREPPTSGGAGWASCCASESSTEATVNSFPRALWGPGGGGSFDVVAGTGDVVVVGGGGGGAPAVVAGVVVPCAVVVGAGLPEVVAGCDFLSPPEEMIPAARAPAAASTATAATAQAFFTRREATLAAEMANHLEEHLKGLPAKPGVYLFRDAKGDVLYIGKAK